MAIPILCLTCLCLLVWVRVLKLQIAKLKKELHELGVKLKVQVQKSTEDVEVEEHKDWGKKSEAMAEH